MPLPPSGADHPEAIGPTPRRTAARCSIRSQQRIFSWYAPADAAVQNVYIMPSTFHLSYTGGAWAKENCAWRRLSMLNRLFRLFSVTAIFLVAVASIAHAAPGQGAVHPEMIVSAQWLSEHL